uniref:DnaJ like subfamily C member 3 n=1 Tax=Ganoderma boninense TaxID=34458 RepID=A0A5K1K575_9APHY|nr:DnaJ like subfamily C member 3 [Ganoderma boninense]
MPALTCRVALGDDPSSSDSGNETVTANPGRATHARANPKGERKGKKPFLGTNLFSTEGLPKLEDFVDMDDLPELLIVYDKSNITNRAPHSPMREPLLFRRAYPKILHKSTSPRRGFLFLDDANTIASGRRSAVHRAPLVATLGEANGQQRKRVTVAVKTANADCRSHHLLREEAKGYAAFPREFFTPSKPIPADGPLPVRSSPPAMRPRGMFPGWGVAMRPKSPAPERVDPPIAPRFYGFYVPVNPDGKSLVRCHSSCKDFANSDCPVPNWAKSLLLMEDCGEPIDSLSMPYKHRDECFELVQRMHRQGFSHGHAHPRNMLVQPGPLSVPPALRSMATPSFRLVSFGRWRGLSLPLPMESALGAKRAFEKGRERDVCLAMDELRVGHSDSSDDD